MAQSYWNWFMFKSNLYHLVQVKTYVKKPEILLDKRNNFHLKVLPFLRISLKRM